MLVATGIEIQDTGARNVLIISVNTLLANIKTTEKGYISLWTPIPYQARH